MKKLLLIFIGLCASLVSFAQFEGTILWNFKLEVTDPKAKAQMEQAQKQMNSPEMQAQMKEMEAKMNDPQMKAMMESNPEIKAMIEQQLAMAKTGGSANVLDAMVPKGMEIKIKGTNTLTKVMGGAMESEVLHLGAQNKSFQLNRANKTYKATNDEKAEEANKYKIVKTEEFATILGYKCRKHIVESSDKAKKENYFVWTTTDIKDLDQKHLSKMQVNGKNGSFLKDIEGFPMKMQMTIPGQGSMQMEVTSVKKEALTASTFEIPAGFTEKK